MTATNLPKDERVNGSATRKDDQRKAYGHGQHEPKLDEFKHPGGREHSQDIAYKRYLV